MRNWLSARLLFPTGIVGLATVLGACSATTYGTGTTPGKQTLDDVAGIISLSGKKAPAIDYKPRGPIVAPPATAALPKPGSEMVATGPDWPRDPDALNAARKAAAGSAAAGADPGFRLPKTAESEIKPHYNDYDAGKAAYAGNINAAKQKTIFATAKGAGEVDANGNPIRTSLTEPPSVYRTPDPTAPTEFNSKDVKKKHWYWPF